VIGVVAPGSKANAIVVVRQSDALFGKSLTLVASEPGGRGRVAVEGIRLR